MLAPVLLRVALWCWALAALAAGRSGWLQAADGRVLAALALALTALVLSASLRVSWLRAWWEGLDHRRVALLHVTRFSGLFLLWFHQRGELPTSFAFPAGIGEILVAAMALPAALAPLEPAWRQRALAIWNVFGLAGLIVTLSHLALLDTPVPALTSLPLSLGPTFLVPLLLVSHVMLLRRPRSNEAGS